MDIQNEKEQIIKELQNINSNVTKEDLQNASMEDLLKYAELNLEIRKKLEILQEMANNK